MKKIFLTCTSNFIAGLDYTSTEKVVTFEAGEAVALIRIPIVDNTAVESDEIFIAALSSEDNNVVFDENSVTIVILDLDGTYSKKFFFLCSFLYNIYPQPIA